MKNKKLSGITLLAISHFHKIDKEEEKIEKMKEEMTRLVNTIPQDEMDEYVNQTSQLYSNCK